MHAFKMAKHAFRWRYQKHLRSLKKRAQLGPKAQKEYALAPYNKEEIKKAIRSVKHIDPRKVRLTKKSGEMKGVSINFVGKGWAKDLKTMQLPEITKLQRRKLVQQTKNSVVTFLKQNPKIAKLTKKARKRKYGFEEGGPIKALRGTLIKKGTKLAYKLATKKYPQLFKKKRFPIAKLKTKKIKTPELESLGVTKTTGDNLRKLSIAEVTKERIRHLGKIVLKHNRKAMPLVWGKASKWRHIEKFQKYNKPKTEAKLKVLGKQHSNLTKYQETIKAKTATKHSEGGEVVIGKNVDRGLL